MIIVKMSVRRLRSLRMSSRRSRVAENPPRLGARRSSKEARKSAEAVLAGRGAAGGCAVVSGAGCVVMSESFRFSRSSLRGQADEGVFERMRGDLEVGAGMIEQCPRGGVRIRRAHLHSPTLNVDGFDSGQPAAEVSDPSDTGSRLGGGAGVRCRIEERQ